jgi:hypothetical protein
MTKQPSVGDVVSVVVDSVLRDTANGGRYHFVRHESLEGLLNLRSNEDPFAEGDIVWVEIIPKGSLAKDFKCKVHIPPAPEPAVATAAPRLVFKPVTVKPASARLDWGKVTERGFALPKDTAFLEWLEAVTAEFKARHDCSAEVARGMWLHHLYSAFFDI